MKKVLFITYYWPPSGKASLHWPLKMIKFLPKFGWQPVVLTVDEDTFSAKDESLLKEIADDLKVLKTKTFEPFDIYKKFTGKKKEEQLVASETISTTNKSLTHRISIWIRMNLFIPDARIGWYFHAVKDGMKLFREEKVDAVVSIGPPHTAHIVGLSLSKKLHVPHVPVFIDPWVNIVYYKNFKRSKLTLLIDNYLERKVLQNSAASVFVTETMKEDYEKKYNFLKDKSHVLYWGYNEDDFENLIPTVSKEETIVHAGNIFDFQNIPAFWKRIKEEIDKGRNLKLKFIGTVSPAIMQSIEAAGIKEETEYAGFLPYKKMLEELNKASYLLVCATEPRHVPGKLFEYLRTGKPVIAFGDDNDEVKNILEKTNAGMMFRYSEDGGEFFNNTHSFRTDITAVKLFDRKNIATSLSKILNSF
ncbi:MAG: glycosyltransferase [Ignavibacteriaceae bacterium]